MHDAHLDAPLRGLDRLTRFSKKHDDPDFNQHYHMLLIFGTAFTPDNLNTRVLHPQRPAVRVADRRIGAAPLRER